MVGYCFTGAIICFDCNYRSISIYTMSFNICILYLQVPVMYWESLEINPEAVARGVGESARVLLPIDTIGVEFISYRNIRLQKKDEKISNK
jgi:hypothetical protein